MLLLIILIILVVALFAGGATYHGGDYRYGSWGLIVFLVLVALILWALGVF